MAVTSEKSPRLELLARDFETFLSAAKDYVRVNEPDRWTSYFSGDLGTVLMELVAHDSGILSYILDEQVQESSIDTLRIRESVLHFVRLTLYNMRRATAATVEVSAISNVAPTSGEFILIPRGLQLRDKNSSPWEVVRDYEITAGRVTPVQNVLAYGDLKGSVIDQVGLVQEQNAMVKIERGSSMAILAGESGQRLSSETNFGQIVGSGQILKLGNTYDGNSFGSPPDIVRDEFAIVSSGKIEQDTQRNSVLYLDRPWDGEQDFLGQWRIENRSIVLRQGETKQETFTVPQEVTQRKSFRIDCNFFPVIMGALPETFPSGLFSREENAAAGVNQGVEVIVNGVPWRETTSLLFEAPDAQVFQADYDDQDRLSIIFGDGVYGSLLPSEAQVKVNYRVGGGKKGNVQQGAFDGAVTLESGSIGTPAIIYLSNPYTTGSGGQDRETLREIKRNIPQHVRTNDRAVTVEDYAHLATNFVDPSSGRIKIAKGVLHTNLVPKEQNIIYVHAWSEGVTGQLAAPSLNLKNRLHEYLNKRKMITDEVIVVDGMTATVPIHVRCCFHTSADRFVARQKVRNAINGVLRQIKPGDPLRLSALYESVEAVSEVKFCLFITPRQDIFLFSPHELVVNSLQYPDTTRVAAPAYADDLSLVVADHSLFAVGGSVTIFEEGKKATTAIIAGIQSSVLTFVAESKLNDSYTDSAVVSNSPYLPFDWQFEQPINIYVLYTSGNGNVLPLSSIIARKIKNYINETLQPEQPLNRARLQTLVQGTINVTEADVYFDAVDSTREQIVPSQSEKVVLGNLVINNQSF